MTARADARPRGGPVATCWRRGRASAPRRRRSAPRASPCPQSLPPTSESRPVKLPGRSARPACVLLPAATGVTRPRDARAHPDGAGPDHRPSPASGSASARAGRPRRDRTGCSGGGTARAAPPARSRPLPLRPCDRGNRRPARRAEPRATGPTSAGVTTPGRATHAANTNGRPVNACHASPRSIFVDAERLPRCVEGRVTDHQRGVGDSASIAPRSGDSVDELRLDAEMVPTEHAHQPDRTARTDIERDAPDLGHRHAREQRHRVDRAHRTRWRVPARRRSVTGPRSSSIDRHEAEVDLAGVQQLRADRRHVEAQRDAGIAIEAVRERTRVQEADRADANHATPRDRKRAVALDGVERGGREVATDFLEDRAARPVRHVVARGHGVDVVGAEQQARLRQLRAHAQPVRLDVRRRCRARGARSPRGACRRSRWWAARRASRPAAAHRRARRRWRPATRASASSWSSSASPSTGVPSVTDCSGSPAIGTARSARARGDRGAPWQWRRALRRATRASDVGSGAPSAASIVERPRRRRAADVRRAATAARGVEEPRRSRPSFAQAHFAGLRGDCEQANPPDSGTCERRRARHARTCHACRAVAFATSAASMPRPIRSRLCARARNCGAERGAVQRRASRVTLPFDQHRHVAIHGVVHRHLTLRHLVVDPLRERQRTTALRAVHTRRPAFTHRARRSLRARDGAARPQARRPGRLRSPDARRPPCGGATLPVPDSRSPPRRMRRAR